MKSLLITVLGFLIGRCLWEWFFVGRRRDTETLRRIIVQLDILSATWKWPADNNTDRNGETKAACRKILDLVAVLSDRKQITEFKNEILPPIHDEFRNVAPLTGGEEKYANVRAQISALKDRALELIKENQNPIPFLRRAPRS